MRKSVRKLKNWIMNSVGIPRNNVDEPEKYENSGTYIPASERKCEDCDKTKCHFHRKRSTRSLDLKFTSSPKN